MATIAPDQLEPRFRSKFTPDPLTGCWVWTACLGGGGYGKYWGGATIGRVMVAHRFAYESLVGPVPDGLQLDHLCRNRACVNPAHLEPVTVRENLLRGVGPSAQAALATHCPDGHPYSGENLYLSPRGDRGCKTCRTDQARASVKRRRERAGKGPAVNNADKTHCPNGHEYTPDNTYRDKINRRSCNACRRDRQRR